MSKELKIKLLKLISEKFWPLQVLGRHSGGEIEQLNC